jgi:hypothetical protein
VWHVALAPAAPTGETGRVKSRILVIIGVVAVLLGGVWTLQGAGVIGGSGMSNSPTWLVIGIVVVIVGLVLIVFGTRGATKPG